MSDPRVSAVGGFTKTKHTSVPSNLDPSKVRLPESFTVCIIGASTGIGEHIAYSFAKAGAANILIASRTLSDQENVATEIRRIRPDGELAIKECDVSKASDVEALAESVKREFGRLDVLILNAGYAGPVTTKMHEGQPEWVQKAFDINAIGTYLAAHYFVPLLLQSENGAKGFFAIGSIAGCLRRGPIANTGYTVSKMAQIRLVEYLYEQYSEEGLVSLAIHPGAVMTRMASGNTPEVFLPYLTDEVDLCGAVCVYLSKQIKDISWLSGRLISATWDMQELMSKKDQVVEKDLLKFVLLTE
ncbi:hypothetical protein H2200_012435 [Cladophialophora chaetospira]|uniref:Uncharacterized protein n=1 Tax=Cladophialophora chaetospira TaxID=386627 RepID=A0AA39CCG6_9EURO|nr:hypothetical protein H2200_012435 [Cladophialophora chaetospira]